MKLDAYMSQLPVGETELAEELQKDLQSMFLHAGLRHVFGQVEFAAMRAERAITLLDFRDPVSRETALALSSHAKGMREALDIILGFGGFDE